jgi:SGNH domain (fused to AT3 domains)
MNGDGRGEFLKKFDMSSPDSVYRQATIAAYTPMCSFYGGPGDVKPVLARPCYVPRSRPVVMLWGDSHAMHLRPGFDALQVKQQQAGKQFEILQVTSGSCHAALEQSDRKTDEARGCNLANALALKTIVQAKPDVVVIAQALGHETTDWARLTTEVTRLGARHVIVVGPVPQWTQGLPQLVAYQYWPVPPTRLKSHLQPEMFAIDRQLRRQIVDTPALSYVSAINFFCDAENACRVSVGTDIMALTSHDSGHLTPVASVAFVEASLAPVLSRFIGK